MLAERGFHVRNGWWAGALAVCVFCGCSARQSAEQGIQNALSNAGIAKEEVFPLGGTVTIDGQPPELGKNEHLVVMLNDPKHPEVPVLSRIHISTGGDGTFQFASYRPGDGVPPGKYVLTFALLKRRGKFGLTGPDRLNNLYNDPDKNAKLEGFEIDHQAPGKTDYFFNLQIAGQTPAAPGPHSLRDLVDESMPNAKRFKK